MPLYGILKKLSALLWKQPDHEDETESAQPEVLPRRSLPKLPDEIILHLVDFLEPESALVLSRVSHRLRDLLHPTHNPERCRFRTRIAFLRLIEHDYPEHILCTCCGTLWNWKSRAPYNILCPRKSWHPDSDRRRNSGWSMRGWRKGRRLWVVPELIELIVRAETHGLLYGLPVSFMSGRTTEPNRTLRVHEARMIRGSVVLASQRESWLRHEDEDILEDLELTTDLCDHYLRQVWIDGGYQPLKSVIAAACTSPQSFKCNVCDSDFELRVEHSADIDTRMVLRAWRNFGNPNMFLRGSCVKIDGPILEGRDIRGLYESQGVGGVINMVE